ncbi:MAG TPA: hypothetical protein VHQ95_10210, partial [Pyrinomonadaceae bacterium]|nr:hypothetical protein [Pyrinomonadaceae bacterium]
MYKFIARSLVLVFAATLAVLMATDNSFNRTVEANGLAADPNPLLAEWAGPYGGLPPFDKVQIAMFKPALEAAMTENLSEVENIARVRSAPTFENTIVALEKAGHTLDRVTTIYGIWGSTMASPEFQVVQREMAPKLAKFNDQITQNEPLFKRIEAVYNSPDKKKLTAEQQRLVWLYYTNFVRSGAKLDATGKVRVGEINQQLAGLFTKFGQNVLFEEDNQSVTLKSEDELKGLPQSVRDAEAASA